VFIGIAGIQRHGVSVHAKKGAVPSPSLVPGGKMRTVRDSGGDAAPVVVGAEKEKRARCFGMFQFRRPV
jgi:hypothetical protein